MTVVELPAGDGPVVSVDDDSDFHMLLKYAYGLSRIENDLITLTTVRKCLEYMDSVANSDEQFPCLLLVDVNMPGIDGCQLVHQIRAIGDFEVSPKIAMLSSSNSQIDIQRSHAAGADVYYIKPMEINELKFSKSHAS